MLQIIRILKDKWQVTDILHTIYTSNIIHVYF